MTQKKSWQLSVFLVQDQYRQAKEIIKEQGITCHDLAIPGCELAKLYVKPVRPIAPKWAKLFESVLDPALIGLASTVSAALLVEVGEDRFVLTFGYGRNLIQDDTCEERFGLICTLNAVNPSVLRSVDIQSLDAIQSHARIQSGTEISVDQFGLNVEQDMLKAVVGAPRDKTLGTRMTGRDSLSVSVQMELSDLPSLLSRYLDLYSRDLNATEYAWANNINLIKGSTSKIESLDSIVVDKFQREDYQDLWLAIPEIIDWEQVAGFCFPGRRKEVNPDINLSGYVSRISSPNEISIARLKRQRVSCVDENFDPTGKSWSIYKCLYAEVAQEEHKYILSGGLWYRVDQDFVTKTNETFDSIPRSPISLPQFEDSSESEYNRRVAEAYPEEYDLLDKKPVFHGGGHGQVEVCDLFSKSKELIHIKRYGESAVLSHLFAQGYVSGQLIQLDRDFREKVVDKLSSRFKPLLNINERPRDESISVVYGIISELSGPDLHLPFFSKVNLNNTYRALAGFGYKVELLKINVAAEHAKTTKIPPRKVKKI